MTPDNHRLLIQVIDDIATRRQFHTSADIHAFVEDINRNMWTDEWKVLSASLITLGLCAFEEMKNGVNHVQS